MLPSEVVQWKVAPGSSDDDAVNVVVGFAQLRAPSGPAFTSGTSVNVPVTKSFRVASTDCDDRVSARNEAKHTLLIPNCVRFTPPSKKLPFGKIFAGPFEGV